MTTPERKVKAAITRLLKTSGAYFTMPMGTGYGSAGVPDYLICHKGKFIGVEAKAGKNRPTKLQLEQMERIRNSGGRTFVINEDNLQELEDYLNE